MKDVNKVYLSGPITSTGHLTARPNYAFLNLYISGIPVVVRYGGKNYNQRQLEIMYQGIKDHPAPWAVVGGDAFMQQCRNKDDRPANWEVSAKETDFAYSQYPMTEYCFVQVRGRIPQTQGSLAPDAVEVYPGTKAAVMWATIESSYFSKNPSKPEDKGSWKDRLVRVKLDRPWGQNIVGHKMMVSGIIVPKRTDGQPLVHVLAFDTLVF